MGFIFFSRMSKATFHHIVQGVRDQIQKMDTKMRQSIKVEQRVAITLWRLSTNIEYRTLGHLFGVGKSTACVIVQETCSAIMQHFKTGVIKIPQGDYLKVHLLASVVLQ